ncbi:hypothetical protein MKW94_026399 [Papaver nudicaule]|uniref:Uncharacterized protein n=1 Tax=Papaver nudicaule TaxID=74823 RepID=A0AA42B2X9_PAPNU|nr:hypothetical protein [Papaver nudicaule]
MAKINMFFGSFLLVLIIISASSSISGDTESCESRDCDNYCNSIFSTELRLSKGTYENGLCRCCMDP